MKTGITILTVLLLSTGLTFAGDTITKEFDVKPGQMLGADIESGGTIFIKGWDSDKVSVKVYLDGRDWENVEVEFDQGKRGVEIYSDFAKKRNRSKVDIEFEIRVPEKFDLNIETAGGSINIENVEGEILGKTMGGKLDLENLKGDIELTTMGGKIKASQLNGDLYLKTFGGNIYLHDSTVDGEIQTMGGNIQLSGVEGDIESSTMGGNVSYEDVSIRSGNNRDEAVHITTKGGNIDVDEAPFGADVHTYGGDITIKSAGRFVKAKTMGGDIEILEVDGQVDAVTMGGDVSVRMTGNPKTGKRNVEISSKGGDIELVLPKDISAEFDIKLAVTKKHYDDYKIISDFDLQIEQSDDWDYSHGTARKYIYGTGSAHSGDNKIHIETINGDIEIIKGD